MGRMMLSTADNPYNPFKQYDLWASYDEKVCGYYSAPLLARFAPVSSHESKSDSEKAIESAIDSIIALNLPIFNPLTGKQTQYIKVYSDTVS